MGSNNTRIRVVALDVLFNEGPMTVGALRDALQLSGGIRVLLYYHAPCRLRLLDQQRCKLTMVGIIKLSMILIEG